MLRAVRVGLRNVSVPVTLAAATTIVSLLMGLFSPIGVIGDFGVVAGLGVGMSLIVMLTLMPACRTVIDRLEAKDPAVGQLLVNNPQGIDTMLIQFPAYSGEPALAQALQRDLEALWFGDDEAITAMSESVIAVTVTDAITDRQTEAIRATVAVALIVLAVFFWITMRQPALSPIAVGPSCWSSSGCWAPWRCWASPTRWSPQSSPRCPSGWTTPST